MLHVGLIHTLAQSVVGCRFVIRMSLGLLLTMNVVRNVSTASGGGGVHVGHFKGVYA
jgi:hypothetical protein